MFFPTNIFADVTRWTEYRTESGRWSKTRHQLSKQAFNSKQLPCFFSCRFNNERRYTTPTQYGLYPYRVTVVSHDGTERRVYTFSYTHTHKYERDGSK